MSLFQNSVLNKYLKGLETEKVKEAYGKFTRHFHNPDIQENIRNSKEEQYQSGFLIDLFVNVLGYIKNPTPGFNLTTELKNIKGSKKTDGAILSGEKAFAVIELKGTNTTDLSKVETQAFGYKNNQPGCNYVITSNFEKLRFYIDNAVDFEEFNLFKLTKERFDILWLCLSSDYLLKDTAKKIKDESLTQEENITKKLYKDYSEFRKEIFDSIQKENPEYDKLTLFKKTQKLLDRFLFIFFAEDKLLLPPNSIRSIVNQWTDLRDKYDEYFPLYDRFKKYFAYMNTGHKGQQHDIFAYNGGLFAPDEILDNIKINDDILFKHTVNLSNYDFESDVSVNILGHIFEHSLNDIETIQSEIGGIKTDQSKTKRKKDGVFYTPKYITKYIVENTIGKLCQEKKIELDIQETEYEKERKGRQKATLKKLTQKLDDYRKWLLQITICDPACGSGAFLNQALEFLIAEHRYIDELQAKLFADAMILSEVENSILENNLFGVDINEESVEIAKLSLWLRTAQKGRKLTTLNKNIKCGNSLIDDPNVAGDKAFNWQNEFPNIFKKKQKKAWHITTATHNSRYSQRMFDYNVKTGDAICLDEEDEIIITKTIADIVKENKDIYILEYNICGDHMHLLQVCEEEELTKIVGKIKGKSSRLYNSNKGINPLVQENSEKSVSLWTQKFGKSEIKDEKYLNNTIEYIRNNRVKHELPENKEIEKTKKEFLCTKEHAFRTEYNDGFDVVIGNPPYVTKSFSSQEKTYLNKKYFTAQYQLDLYISFMELGTKILSSRGVLSYIVPNSWLKNIMFDKCRSFVLNNLYFDIIIPNLENIFTDASVDTLIFIASKSKFFNKEIEIGVFVGTNYRKKHNVNQKRFFENDKFIFDVEISAKSESIFKKIEKQCIRLSEISEVTRGINPYDKYRGQSPDIIKNKLYHSNYIKDRTFVPEIRGKHVNRYSLEWDGESYVSYGTWLAAPREPKFFEGDRIICRQVLGANLNCTFIDSHFIIDQSVFIAKFNEEQIREMNPKFVLTQLTSKLTSYYFRYKANEFDALFPKIKIGEYKLLPVKKTDKEKQQPFIEKADKMLDLNKNFQQKKSKFLNRLIDNLGATAPDKGTSPLDLKITKKLENFYDFDFKTFVSELKKKKVVLSLLQQDEWEEYFNAYKTEINNLQNQINQTDKEIDQMVYELYGLTETEIKIVEEATA
jgi:REP element-mobilizing transposase RayT